MNEDDPQLCYTDVDGDGYGDMVVAEGVEAGLDCDDTDPTVYLGAIELEDGIDNDCDGEIDNNR